jgi:hypothetical protein
MKMKLVLALVAVVSAAVVLISWKPAPAPLAEQSGATLFEQTALEQAAGSSLEPARETDVPLKSAFVPRKAQTPAQNQAAMVAADLLAQIRAALASKNFSDREFVFTNLLVQWVHADPFAAAGFAETNAIGYTRDQILHRVAQLWAATDSSAALNWAATLNNPAEREAILTEVCLQVAESDPAEAIRIRGQFVTDAKPNEGLEALIQRWAEKDLPAALDWGLSHTAGERRDQLVARVAYVQSQTSPFDAATLVTEKIPPGRTQTEAAIAVLHQWASQDMAAAGQWVARFPEGDLRARGLKELGIVARFQTAGQPR